MSETQWGVRTTYTDGSVGIDWGGKDDARSFLDYYADYDGNAGMRVKTRELVRRTIVVTGPVEVVESRYREAREAADVRRDAR